MHLVASGGLYGIERMLLDLLPALRARGCPAALVCLGSAHGPGHALGQAAAALGVPVSYAGLAGRISPKGLLRLRKILRSASPRVMHFHGYKATIVAGTYAVARRAPAVATFHTHAAHDVHVSSSIVRFESQILRRLRGIVAVSEPVRLELMDRGVPSDRVRVIPNGIADRANDQPRAAHPRAGPVLLCVGRLIRKKNVHVLLDALHRLAKPFPDIRLLLAGEGPFREALERQCAALGLGDRVEFLGFVEDVPSLLRRCDCFVLPSQTEGMPISVLEAMSCAVPIVATEVGSIPAIARDESEAILVPPNDVDRLAEALERVLGNPPLRHTLASAARARFLDGFTAGRMADRYLEFYRDVLPASEQPLARVPARDSVGPRAR